MNNFDNDCQHNDVSYLVKNELIITLSFYISEIFKTFYINHKVLKVNHTFKLLEFLRCIPALYL